MEPLVHVYNYVGQEGERIKSELG